MNDRRIRALAWMAVAVFAAATAAQAAPGYGKISGVVVDPVGTPQLGATVLVTAEGVLGPVPVEFLTNQRGVFSAVNLLPGEYSLKVTLAGFLPEIEHHIKVTANLTTLVRIELGSVFASLDRLRRRSDVPVDPEEWKWVLRTSAATRPVLQWQDGQIQVADASQPAGKGETGRRNQPRARVELTSGSLQHGSASHLPDAPGTAFVYDQTVGRAGRLLLAGQMSYERTAAGGLSALWLPSGETGVGPSTSLVVRQSKLGPGGLTFRGMRLAHADSLRLNDRLRLQYGVEYVMVGLGRAATSLRPRLELDARLNQEWQVYGKVAGMPVAPESLQAELLQSALAAMDAFPALLRDHGRTVLEGGWHDEMGFERRVGPHSYLDVAGFHDRLSNLAIYGRGPITHYDFFQDSFSDAVLYDGGYSNSWGTRVAYRQKISDDLEVMAVYAWAGAMMLNEAPPASEQLRDALQTRYTHSLAARVTGRLPGAGTRVMVGYKWLNNRVVSRQDPYGESALQIDPYLNLSVRQPLPTFFMNGKWEAMADFRNLLAEGYVPVNRRVGEVLLIPAMRSFRGGVSIQF